VTLAGLAILFSSFGFRAPKTLNYLAFQLLNLSVLYEGYSRNASDALNLISTFLSNYYKVHHIDQLLTFQEQARF
jgi:hypothetical protein